MSTPVPESKSLNEIANKLLKNQELKQKKESEKCETGSTTNGGCLPQLLSTVNFHTRCQKLPMRKFCNGDRRKLWFEKLGSVILKQTII